jgi:hypothetical protein
MLGMYQTAVRIEFELLRMLQKAAADNHRNVSQEIRQRLWSTFADGVVMPLERSKAVLRYVRAWEEHSEAMKVARG